jgi:hypothetical protein
MRKSIPDNTGEEAVMAKHDESRRAFLVGAAVGAGAVAGTTMVSGALAQHHKQPKTAEVPDAHGHDSGEGHGAFLNDDNAATVAAFAERLMPGAPGKPGARGAGVLNYIDLALAGAYSDQQDFYRRGLAALDAYCRKTFNQPFVKLSAAQQDEVITALEQGNASEFTYPTAQAFFNAIRTHTMEGMFALRRQQGLRRLEAGRLSRRPAVLHPRGHAEQAGLQPRARHRPPGSGQNRIAKGLNHANRKD